MKHPSRGRIERVSLVPCGLNEHHPNHYLEMPRVLGENRDNLGYAWRVVAVIGLCYGGGFGTMPSFSADFFGARYRGGIYGWILLEWGAAAIPSRMLIARVRETT